MRAEEFLFERTIGLQKHMNEYERVVFLRDALIAVNMARKEILDKVGKEVSNDDISLRTLIRLLRDESKG